MTTASRVGVLLVMGSVLSCPDALACDEPGTPNEVHAIAISAHAVRLYWSNTASENDVYFDIEGRTDPSIANFGPYHRDHGHPQQLERDIGNLSTGVQHCFRVWARVGVNGCRSRLPSAWTCATPLGHEHGPEQPARP